MKILPHNYQTTCVKHCIENNRAALFLDMGLGKTVIILTVINYLLNSLKIRGVLIIAPLRVVYNVWPLEIKKWNHIGHLKYGILHGNRKDKEIKTKNDIYITNYDSLNWLCNKLNKYKRDRFPFDMIIFDESTAIKNPQTKRFKMLRNIIKAFPRRIILTGTPAPNSLEDLWAQYFLLDDGERLGTSKYRFRDRYFYPADYNHYRWRPYPTTAKILGEKVQDITVRLSAKDYLKMPKLINNEVYWSMSDATKQKYKEFEKEFLIELDRETVTAVNAASLSTKLRQFLSGFLYNEGKQLDVHTEKLDVLDELIDDRHGEPKLVAIQFRHEYDMIKKRYQKAPVIFGGMNTKTVNQTIKNWNYGEIPILIVHPASIAHGINLQQGGRILIWYSLPWSWEHYTQLRARIYRQGQEKPVISHHIIAKKTVEEDVIKALLDKRGNEKTFTKQLITQIRSNNELHCQSVDSGNTESKTGVHHNISTFGKSDFRYRNYSYGTTP